MSPNWWDRWFFPRSLPENRPLHPAETLSTDLPVHPIQPGIQPATPHSTSPVIVVMPGDWLTLWNNIRRWHESSTALQARISIAPPLGPRRFLLDSTVTADRLIAGSSPIEIGQLRIGQVDLGFAPTTTAGESARLEAENWAKAIASFLSRGRSRLDAPAQAA